MNANFPKPGENFEGYHLQSILGAGGYSKVFRATENATGRAFAIKVANPPDSVRGQTAEKRFKREAAIIKKLESPHTVRLFRAGHTRTGNLYMVLELVEGTHIGELVNQLGPANSLVLAELLAQCLTGLAEAHRYGVIHRDIKPDNILVVAENDDIIAKIIDFGVAKPPENEYEKLTREGFIVGTPHFMSPEQILAKNVTPASDIYSLGVVGYYLAVGSLPFHGDMAEAFGAHLSDEPFRIPADVSLEPRIERILHRMLEKDLSKRYATCEEALAELKEFAEPLDRRRVFRTTMQTLSTMPIVSDFAATEKDMALPKFEEEQTPIKRGRGIKRGPKRSEWQPDSLAVDRSVTSRSRTRAKPERGYHPADYAWFALTALFALLTLVVLILRGM